MKKLILISGAILLSLNLLLGALLSSYSAWNVGFVSLIILVNAALLWIVQRLKKDAFRISMTLLFPILFLIELPLGLFSPEKVRDNWCIIVFLFLLAIQILSLLIINKVSQSAGD